jgi:hypothetical protein
VKTVSGDFRADRWVASNCGLSLVAGAVGAGVTCATGVFCDSDSARVTGAIVLGSVAALVVVGVVALASCKTCWAWR